MEDEILFEEEQEMDEIDTLAEIINNQDDYEENEIYKKEGELENILYSERKSLSLNQKIITIPRYINVVNDEKLVGRRPISYQEIITTYGDTTFNPIKLNIVKGK
jgi:hypothetical protein